MLKRIFTGLLLLSFSCTFAQTTQPKPDILNGIKLSGYFQFQYQKASKPAISSFDGGDFADNSDSRFMLRRGRLKLERTDKWTNLVVSIDATQDGVSLRDAFIELKEPLLNSFTLTAGQMNKPFGYAIGLSSSQREIPERPRVVQTVLPGERDLGVMLTLNPANYKFITLDAGFYNGSGLNVRDYDNRKDFISNLTIKLNNDSLHHFKIGFGASYYHGYVRQNTATVYYKSTENGVNGFTAITDPQHIGSYAKREYTGFNLQLEDKGSMGRTALKAEYIQGKQPGIAASATVRGPQATKSFSSQPASDIYNRKFKGYYIWFIKQIPQTPFEVIANYDVYDPNTDLKGSNIGIAGNNTTAADIQYHTFGAGLICYVTKQVKLTAYYDHPVNEKTQLAGFENDIKDDVFTLRAQYRF
ncbi:porin [Rubrolithibacter danxiaensis]|uniref:porin n=1 Tax=Rubrolithibacter danxiaensis TaxID=3390805 RepID=UPI003BF8AE06